MERKKNPNLTKFNRSGKKEYRANNGQGTKKEKCLTLARKE